MSAGRGSVERRFTGLPASPTALVGPPGGAGLGLLPPPRTVFPPLRDVVIQTFQSGHGWTLSGTTGATYADDTTDFCLGAQSVRLTTGGAGATHEIRSPVLTAIDLSTRNLVLAVKVDNYTHFSDFQIRVSSNGFSDFMYCKPLNTSVTQRWVEPGKWHLITIGRGKMVSGSSWGGGQWQVSGVEGNVNWSAVTGIRLRVVDAATGPVTVRVNLLSHFPQPTQAVLVNMFDDGRLTHHTEAKRRMDLYRMPGTAAIICNSLNTGSAYMSTAQVLDLQETSGWDIVVHAYDNATGSMAHANGYDGITYGAGEADILRAKMAMHVAGLCGQNILLLPHGSWSINTPGTVGANTDVMGLVRKYFDVARTTYGPTWETYPPADRYKLRSYTVTNADTAAAMLNVLDQGIAGKHLMLMQWHNIVSPADSTTDATPAVFQAFIDGVQARVAAGTLAVRTLHQVLQNGMV